jgi:phage baseplate assembly protein V
MNMPVERRVQMMVARGTLAAVNDETMLQELQVELLSDEVHEGVEHFQTYGLAAHPHPDAELVVIAPGGLRSHALVIAVGDRRYRMKGMEQGEVSLYDDQGQHVLLGRDGIVIHGKKLTFESEGDIAFECEKFTVTASDTVALDSDDVTIGTGATLQAARKTDAISGGAINGGSTKVKIA